MADAARGVCLFCSLGCGLSIESQDGEPLALEYDQASAVNEGTLCAKGNYLLELLNHRRRLAEPRIGGSVVSWQQAAASLANLLRSPSTALIVEGDLSDEEARLLPSFAASCMESDNWAVNFSTGDDEVLRALESVPVPEASTDDLRESACTVAVGDPFSVGPVVARHVMHARNASRDHRLHVVRDDRHENVAARFAQIDLGGGLREGLLALLHAILTLPDRSAPGWSRPIVEEIARTGGPPAVDEVQAVAAQFANAQSGVLVVSTADPVAAQLAGCCALAAGERKRFSLVHDYGNAAGICRSVAPPTTAQDILDRAARGAVDALCVLGADPVAALPDRDVEGGLKGLRRLAAGAVLPNRTTTLADTALPTSVWLEKHGTFNGSMRSAAAEPVGAARSYGEIMHLVAQVRGVNLHPYSGRTAPPVQDMSPELARAMVHQAREPAPATGVRSTAVRFGDGALTDMLSFPQAIRTQAV